MPNPPLRIAILECDTPLANTKAKYGGYGGVFTALLRAGADALDYPVLSAPNGLILSSWDVVDAQQYPSLEDIDAILISGSKHNAFENRQWMLTLVEFTKKCLDDDRVRVIGVCFGHQIVGRALGFTVQRSDRGWEASVTAIDLTKKGQELFRRPALALHQMHRDIVVGYPEGVERLAYTEKCDVQAMYVPKRFITVQGHPEFTEEIVRELLEVRHKTGVFDDTVYKDAMDRVDKYQDGVVVAQAFLRFLLE